MPPNRARSACSFMWISELIALPALCAPDGRHLLPCDLSRRQMRRTGSRFKGHPRGGEGVQR